jgi:hypothetical protein
VAVFATFVDVNDTVQQPFLGMGPMQNPNDDDDEKHAMFGAISHMEYLSYVLSCYGKSFEHVQFIVGDNCNVNKAIPTAIKNKHNCNVPLVGCASHRLHVAVEKLYTEEDFALIEKVHAFMLKLKTISNTAAMRDKIKEEDYLSPIIRNKTRWLSTFNMLKRFKDMYPLLADVALKDTELPDATVLRAVNKLIDKLQHVHNIMTAIQGEDYNKINLSLIRLLFDGRLLHCCTNTLILCHSDLIEAFSQMEFTLGQEAFIINKQSRDFEDAVCMLQTHRVAALEGDKLNAVACFLKAPPREPAPSVHPPGSVEARIEEHQARVQEAANNVSSTSKYTSTKHVTPTSCIVERLFSTAKQFFPPERRSMHPQQLELCLYLHSHRKKWSVSTVHTALLNRKNIRCPGNLPTHPEVFEIEVIAAQTR